MKEYLPIIGLGFILYGGSRLFHYLGMVFKESFGIIFLGLSFLLGLCSFPVSIVMYGIEHLHEEHMRKIVEQNTRAERSQWYEELRQTDQKIYYDKGEKEGYKRGYLYGYKNGYDQAVEAKATVPLDLSKILFNEYKSENPLWTIPAKAQPHLKRIRRQLYKGFADVFCIPDVEDQKHLLQLIDILINECLRTGDVSQKTLDIIFERWYESGMMVDRQLSINKFDTTIPEILDDLRYTKRYIDDFYVQLYIDEHSLEDIRKVISRNKI